MQPTHEQWLPTVGHLGYEVSDQGRVRSYRRQAGAGLRDEPKIMSLALSNRGYYKVTLDGRTRPVHILVAEAFIGPRPDGWDVAHNDGDSRNNSVGNLRYATKADNSRDAVVHGTALGGNKLTFAQVDEIRARYGTWAPYGRSETGVTVRSLAEEYGVSYGMIGKIVRGAERSWTRGPDHPVPIPEQPSSGYTSGYASVP